MNNQLEEQFQKLSQSYLNDVDSNCAQHLQKDRLSFH